MNTTLEVLSVPADEVGQYTYRWMPTRTEPSADDYLAFSQADLAGGASPRHLVNGLSNAKRALHLRLEDLALGFGAANQKDLRNFPKLVAYVRNCGLVTPRILDRLNKLRNAVEHEYVIPALSEVENLIDVTELFLAATERWIQRQPCDVDFGPGIKDETGEFNLHSLGNPPIFKAA